MNLAPVPFSDLEPSVYIVSSVWLFVCNLTVIVCFLAVSLLGRLSIAFLVFL
jgi:hypothetical protein